MPKRKKTSSVIFNKLRVAGWPGLEIDVEKNIITCPEGTVFSKKNGDYNLAFYYYSQQTRSYGLSSNYSLVSFPTNFDITKYLSFRMNGNYNFICPSAFKTIVNPLGKTVTKIRISEKSSEIRFYKSTLIIPTNIFRNAIRDAKKAFNIASAYKNSTQNYLSNQYSRKYNSQVRKGTTYLKAGEIKFLVDRYYLKNKRKTSDFTKFINGRDVNALEELVIQFLRNKVFSNKFIRVLDEFFIKEKLAQIINIGREIISLRSPRMDTQTARDVVLLISDEHIGQLEGLWQKYFENYLLYLIFTYKQIFPKVELKNIQGGKRYPDFIGVNHYNGLDVIEIKTHLKSILTWDQNHQNYHFSAEVSKAIVQTTNYMDAIVQRRFQDDSDEKKITSYVDSENLYHPRGIIIISSFEKITSSERRDPELERDFTKLRNSLKNIEILTFDEVLGIAGEYLKNITPKVQD